MPTKFLLHAVIIDKSVPIERAKEISQKFIKNPNRKFYRETGTSFRFRNISKQKFEKFFSKKLNDKITLIYGLIKPKWINID